MAETYMYTHIYKYIYTPGPAEDSFLFRCDATKPHRSPAKMLSSDSTLVVIGGLALVLGITGVRGAWPQNVDVDSFVSTERTIALEGALNNIGPDGSEAAGAGAGFVVASPSKANPNCKSHQLNQKAGRYGD